MGIVIGSPLTRCQELAVVAEEWVSSTMKLLVEQKALADERVRGMFGAEVHVDEMSLLFTEPSAARQWVDMAVMLNGVTLFNTARDVVHTAPIQADYEVHYWFLTAPEAGAIADWKPWRIEAMYAHRGSPLHDSFLLPMRKSGEDVGVMHASFKCATEEDYAVAVRTLADNGYECAQRCESSYGRFGYWYPIDIQDNEQHVALKPRVNLRDVSAGE